MDPVKNNDLCDLIEEEINLHCNDSRTRPEKLISLTDKLIECIERRNIPSFWSSLGHSDYTFSPTKVEILGSVVEGQPQSSLSIDFSENRLVTKLNGEEKSLTLSSALSIITRLSEIFNTETSEKDSQELFENYFPISGDEMSSQENNPSSLVVSHPNETERKPAVETHLEVGQVVLVTTQATTSLPLSVIHACSHLFNKAFAKEICPSIRLEPTISNLQKTVFKMYIGKCIETALKHKVNHGDQSSLFQCNMRFIVNQLISPGSEFFPRA